MLTPSLTASLAAAHSSAIAFSRPGPSCVGSNSIGSVRVLKPPMAGGVGHAGWIDVALSSSPTQRSLATSSLLRTGYLTSIWRHGSGVGSSRLPSGPMVEAIDVISSSRIASSGGLVTCANSCLK